MSAYVDDSMDIPIASNRIWYEVDINYESGYRNNSRIQPYRWIIQCYRFPLRAFGRGGFLLFSNLDNGAGEWYNHFEIARCLK